MRISDWSSDVCSSDLIDGARRRARPFRRRIDGVGKDLRRQARGLHQGDESARRQQPGALDLLAFAGGGERHDDGARSEERRVGKECVVRVDLGGSRLLKTKKKQQRARIELYTN